MFGNVPEERGPLGGGGEQMGARWWRAADRDKAFTEVSCGSEEERGTSWSGHHVRRAGFMVGGNQVCLLTSRCSQEGRQHCKCEITDVLGSWPGLQCQESAKETSVLVTCHMMSRVSMSRLMSVDPLGEEEVSKGLEGCS